MAKSKYPTAPRQTGKWTVTTNAQKRTMSDKVSQPRPKAVVAKAPRRK